MQNRLPLVGAAALGFVIVGQAMSGDLCPFTTGPDVVVGDLPSIQYFGAVGGVSAFSLATTSCNVGDENLPWFPTTADHPVIAQHMYKLTDRRIEQIGLGFVKHGFGALQDSFCCEFCEPSGSFNLLGIGCSDPYTTGLNGDQDGFNGIAGLGPRFEVNAATGDFAFPYTFQGQSGDATYKRLQVANADLDPFLNLGARYFIEGHYITPADAQAGNGANNASHREAMVTTPSGGGFDMLAMGPVTTLLPAIYAWAAADPEVTIDTVDVPLDGRLVVASRAFENEDGSYTYEYAVHNINSHRSVGRFAVQLPFGATARQTEFHDVDYHSGDPFDGTDWTPLIEDAREIVWSTDTFLGEPDANALRWGTLYNFAFTISATPAQGAVSLGLFRPGTPDTMAVNAVVPGQPLPCPADVNGDGAVDFEDLLAVLSTWGPCAACAEDIDASGAVDFADLLAVLSSWGPC